MECVLINQLLLVRTEKAARVRDHSNAVVPTCRFLQSASVMFTSGNPAMPTGRATARVGLFIKKTDGGGAVSDDLQYRIMIGITLHHPDEARRQKFLKVK